jgi:hypothetical protein
MQVRLERAGVTDVRGLWDLTEADSVRIWGSVEGARWWRGFHAVDEPRVPKKRSSMSHGMILPFELRNPAGARGMLERLIYRLGRRLVREKFFAKRLSVSVLDIRGRIWWDETGLPCTQDTPVLLQHFETLWSGVPWGRDRPKKVDVTVSGLEPAAQRRLPFEETEKLSRLSGVMDAINRRTGDLTISFGSTLGYKQKLDSKIAFGRVPSIEDEPAEDRGGPQKKNRGDTVRTFRTRAKFLRPTTNDTEHRNASFTPAAQPVFSEFLVANPASRGPPPETARTVQIAADPSEEPTQATNFPHEPCHGTPAEGRASRSRVERAGRGMVRVGSLWLGSVPHWDRRAICTVRAVSGGGPRESGIRDEKFGKDRLSGWGKTGVAMFRVVRCRP